MGGASGRLDQHDRRGRGVPSFSVAAVLGCNVEGERHPAAIGEHQVVGRRRGRVHGQSMCVCGCVEGEWLSPNDFVQSDFSYPNMLGPMGVRITEIFR